VQLRVAISSQQRISVLGNGTIDVGKDSGPSERPVVERVAMRDSLSGLRIEKTKVRRAGGQVNCGAMAQQRDDSGNASAPQELVQLVGCRDPKARPQPWVRPVPRKR
jgi:hypothetical protein